MERIGKKGGPRVANERRPKRGLEKGKKGAEMEVGNFDDRHITPKFVECLMEILLERLDQFQNRHFSNRGVDIPLSLSHTNTHEHE